MELREVSPEDCDGGGEHYRLRWRRVVVDDGMTDELRREMRHLRALGLYKGLLAGDELPPPPGSTRRGIPQDYDGTDPRLCNARTRTGRPCRSLALPSGRCRWHGGKSTGPRTEAGKQQAARNLALARAVLAARGRGR